MSKSRRSFLPLLLLLAIAAAGGIYWLTRKSNDDLLREAQQALDAGNLEEAETLAAKLLKRDPQSIDAAVLASRAAFNADALERSYDYLDVVFQSHGEAVIRAHVVGGEIQLRLKSVLTAEKHFREALKLSPEELIPLQQLSYMLTVQGRTREAIPFRLRLFRQGRFSRPDLMFVGNRRAISQMPEPEFEALRKANPNVGQLDLAVALRAWRKNEVAKAEKHLRSAIEHAPELVEAHARLGELLIAELKWDAFLEWTRKLPSEATDHTDIWHAWGMWSEHKQEPRAAARCFWEAMKRDPNHQAACYHLAINLNKIGQAELAKPFMERAKTLQELEVALTRASSHSEWTSDLVAPIAAAMYKLGRKWEADGWYRELLRLDPRFADARTRVQELQRELANTRELVMTTENVATKVDLATYPMPQFDLPPSVRAEITQTQAVSVSFRDIAVDAGIRFHYFNSDDPTTEGRRMFEFTGGGVAILDYDRDGLPDIYLTQGTKWDIPESQATHFDRLFRNLGGNQFEDVTEQSGLGDRRFSQGAAIGDVNNDGFPDIFLANVNENRLYINNGDGTFQDVSSSAGIGGERWSTSCLIADLNGDGWADLYEVNYLQGENVFDFICDKGSGRARSCSPTEFDAQQDRFFLNNGDGTFVERTRQAGFQVANGKGLGIVAACLDESQQLSLFIANDMTANFHFANRGEQGKVPKFEERAVISGLAYDKNAKAQACMGIAFGDVDGDRLPEIYVTNFFDEYNTLFRQQKDYFFRDETRESRLVESSRSMLGFGTQFLDGELDGHLDIVIANGHVDDYSYANTPFQMRPQYMSNQGNGTFREIRDTAGDYFRRKLLGRGLAKLDVNADGKEDFIVSHLDAPVAVLLNTTKKTGHFIGIRLEATASQRDAIGTRITVKTAKGQFFHQRTAGDGYFASNQQQIIAGVGEAKTITELIVEWPSGKRQVFSGLAADQHYQLIEGDVVAHPLKLK